MSDDTNQAVAEDDWAAAMAEQTTVPATKAESEIFPELAGNTVSGGLANDIDFILDIPVLL
ncbi:MAG: flagellar motor switch protein FliN, partial [Thiobacillus sp.]|nr:flagellar motor switch protein FliN [Thiobacillus sp.]